MNTDDELILTRRQPELSAMPMPDQPEPRFVPSRRMWRWSIVLFLLTCASTFYVGMSYAPLPPGMTLQSAEQQLLNGGPQRSLILQGMLWGGFQYSAAIMGMLLFHEFGHYLQARRYHVPAIPPLFIPMPFQLFGTMGAVIVQSPHHADRKAMFDIAISGPLAGLCVAIPVAWLGAASSQTMIIDGPPQGMYFNDPLILHWMYGLVHGSLAANEVVLINPLLMAGWVGIFITALNLMPIGQLDGGHLLYCLIGRKAHFVAVALVWIVVGYMIFTQYWVFSLMIVLLVLMGLKHPPTTNDRVPLGSTRVLLGWLTLSFLLIGLNPQPIVIHDSPAPAAAIPSALNPENAKP